MTVDISRSSQSVICPAAIVNEQPGLPKLAAVFVAESRLTEPRVLWSIPQFRLLLVVQLLFWSSSSVFLMLPKYLALQLHANAIWIGLIMGGLGLGAVSMAPAIGILSRYWGRRRCLVAANLMMSAGSLL